MLQRHLSVRVMMLSAWRPHDGPGHTHRVEAVSDDAALGLVRSLVMAAMETTERLTIMTRIYSWSELLTSEYRARSAEPGDRFNVYYSVYDDSIKFAVNGTHGRDRGL